MQTTEEKIRHLLEAQLGLRYDDIRLSSKLIEDLGMDSLDGVEVMIELEEAFSIEIPDDDLTPNFETLDVTTQATVGDIVDYIEKRLGTGAKRQ